MRSARFCNFSRSSDKYVGRELWNTGQAYSVKGRTDAGQVKKTQLVNFKACTF